MQSHEDMSVKDYFDAVAHEHSWAWIVGRMEVKCDKGHWHEVQEGYDFEACWCGEIRGDKQYICDEPRDR